MDVAERRSQPGNAKAPAGGMKGRQKWPPLIVTLYILAILVPLSFKLGPVLLSTIRVLLIIMVFPLAFKLVCGKAGKLTATDILLGLHLLWIPVALAVNNPDKVIEQSGSVGVEFIGGYLVARTAIRTREDFLALGRMLILAIVVFIPFAIYETLTGDAILLDLMRSLPGLNAPPDLGIGKRLGLDRVQMTFVHPIHYGLFCSVSLAFWLVAMKGRVGETRRYIGAVAICATGFLALSSGAILAIVLQLGLVAWSMALSQVKERWWVLLGVFAAMYVFLIFASNRSPIEVFLSYATFSSHTAYYRLLIFEYGIQNIWANPVFGLGLNDWERARWMASSSVDNFWLTMAMRYGIPGFLFLAGGYLLGLFRILFRDLSADPELRQLRQSWVFTIVGLTFTLCTVHVWNAMYSYIFFIFGAGMWLKDAPLQTTASIAPLEETARQADRHSRSAIGRYTRFTTPTESRARARR